MTDDQLPSGTDEEEVLPARLREDLARLSPVVRVPESIDAAVLSRAKADYSRRSRFRLAIRWASTVIAAAAVVALVFFLRMVVVHPGRPGQPLAIRSGPPSLPHPLSGDINGDGKVDMLDAYILARRLASGAKLDPAWDVNRDGVVDQNDVDWIANAAVALPAANSNNGGAAQ